ncbi:hypothetical protein C8Q70DRAFT_1109664 [Cubamyces menziesii]|nr:hypothetical protein C8Q70DRAFT_1109664 [Cubamyces menziesii]
MYHRRASSHAAIARESFLAVTTSAVTTSKGTSPRTMFAREATLVPNVPRVDIMPLEGTTMMRKRPNFIKRSAGFPCLERARRRDRLGSEQCCHMSIVPSLRRLHVHRPAYQLIQPVLRNLCSEHASPRCRVIH